MANRLVGNVIIVDSGMGNLPIVGGTSANITNYEITAFAFLGINTTASCVLTEANTATDVVFNASLLQVNSAFGFLIQQPTVIHFSRPLRLNNLKAPTVTAGTAWVYLA